MNYHYDALNKVPAGVSLGLALERANAALAKANLAFIRLIDEQLCCDVGLRENAYNTAFKYFEDDMETLEILNMADATDGVYYFPEWHPGIENTLRVDAGSRADFLEDMFLTNQ